MTSERIRWLAPEIAGSAKLDDYRTAGLIVAQAVAGRLCLELNLDGIVYDSRWKRRMAQRGAEHVLAGSDVKLPAMPWTGDDASLDFAGADWAARVRADAVHRVNVPIDIEDSDNLAVGDDFFAGSSWNLFKLGDRYPVWHLGSL